MKKIIALIVLAVFIFEMISCEKSQSNQNPNENEKPEKYQVLEVGDYDYISDANHKREISLSIDDYQNAFAKKNVDINYRGTSYQVEYKNSRKDYLYNSDCDVYTKYDDEKLINIWINQNNGRMDRWNITDRNYLNNKSSDKKLTEDECINIAKEYLKNFTDDISEYEISSYRFDKSSTYDAEYTFDFYRFIDGVRTFDAAIIHVTIYGDVVGYVLYSFGEMKDAKLPSDYEKKIIDSNIEEKIQSIYANMNKFSYVSHKLKDTVFMRMSDGRYAIDLTYEVKITPDSTEDIMPDELLIYNELLELVVYLD